MMLCSGLVVVCLLLLQSGALGFLPTSLLAGKSIHHVEITERALLSTILLVCRDVALSEGRDFAAPSGTPSAENVAAACSSQRSARTFNQAIKLIVNRNAMVDIRHYFDTDYHFTDERLLESRDIITDGLAVVKTNIKTGNFDAARQTLGDILHPLQDFYSHSNWVEIGYKVPNSNLIRRDTSIGKIAESGRPTCRNCVGNDCRNNILEDILKERVLTSTYFGFKPFFAGKPAGKCSHGGIFDFSSRTSPTGGINKDTLDSSHGFLHLQAADMAVAATRELLEDLRGDSGNAHFLRLMGISTDSNKALCFVIDTTGSVSDDMAAVKSFTTSLVDSRRGTAEEPSLYILVPFSDQDVGPLIKTTDPNDFKTQINALSANGGEDPLHLSFSGLQLALLAAPPGSDIFHFTDSPAKDTHLSGTVTTLIERTKSTVTFKQTGSLGLRRRRRRLSNNDWLRRTRVSDGDPSKDQGQRSGPQGIQVTKAQLPDAASVITDASSHLQVTDIIRPVCQVIRVSANCSADCSLTTWQLSANLTDGNGTGIESLTLRQGNGTLNTSTVVGTEGYNVTLVSYSASCCSPDVVLVAVDRMGNVGYCVSTTTTKTSTTTHTLTTTKTSTTTHTPTTTKTFPTMHTQNTSTHTPTTPQTPTTTITPTTTKAATNTHTLFSSTHTPTSTETPTTTPTYTQTTSTTTHTPNTTQTPTTTKTPTGTSGSSDPPSAGTRVIL